MGRLTLLVVVLAVAGCSSQTPPTDALPLEEDFKFVERSGREVSRDDLKGRVWIASCIFTCCTSDCPKVMGAMAGLQHDLAHQPNVVLVSFSVDPERDTPQVLHRYAETYGADPQRWLFLTGDKAKLHRFIEKGLRLGVSENQGTARASGNEFMHSPKLVLVDKEGRVRGWYDAREPEKVEELRKRANALVRE